MQQTGQAIAVVALIALAFACSAHAQLNGIYTCANGNPGGAFDYADIGDFFDALELQGINGPVTLEIFDDGGPFTSKPSYQLWNGAQTGMGVAGLSLANPLVIRAAAGERPRILGGGVPFGAGAGPALGFGNIGYLTVDGLTLTGGPGGGIYWGAQGQQFSNVRIAGCSIHGVRDREAIRVNASFNNSSANPDALIIENNMIWDCKVAPAGYLNCIFCTHGIECIVRHNTIVYLGAPDNFDLIYLSNATTSIPVVHVPVEQFHSNILYFTSVGTTTNPSLQPIFLMAPAVPTFMDHNIYFKQGNVYLNLPGWQALGHELSSIEADPMLVSVLPGFEDLHLLPGSPAINFSPVQSVTVDADGEPRPVGLRDAGADEYIPPDTQVEYNAAPIAHAGVVNLGNVPVTGAQFSFTIRNTGPGVLRLTASPAVALAPGANCDPATAVQAQPGAVVIAPAAFTSFSLYIKAAVPGGLDFVVSIPSNDPTKSPYTFTVNATGLGVPPPNMPAVANPGAGSVFAGPANGPFVVQVNPGTALTDFVIDLTDPEADAITVVSITLLTANPAGILPPGTGIPLHPRSLQWFGTAAASNPPGSYTWRLQFRDAVNLSIITSDVTIQILNTPPAHLPAATIAGNGSQAAPYAHSFYRGDGPATTVALATVTDPNTSQVVGIAGIVPGANPGNNFNFTLNAGVLSAAPAAMLAVADSGLHQYVLQLSDGANTIDVHVALTVINLPLSFTTQQLPVGATGQPYNQPLQLSGAFGARTFTVTTGTLPDGLQLDQSTGQITGTPTQAANFTFTVQATDATSATATQPLEINITTTPTQPDSQSSDNSGCSLTASAPALPIAALLMLAALRRRDKLA